MRTLYKFLRAGVVSVLFVQVGFAQKDNVGIGTTKPDQSAILDLSSTNKGLLIPRVSLQQRNSIQNPANGLIVYQTDMLSGFYYYDGKNWKSVGSETAQNSVADAFNWGLTGNAGTSAATNFIGTTDNVPLIIKTNNIQVGKLGYQNNIFLGDNSGLSNTSSFNIGIGADALRNLTPIGSSNVAIGFSAMKNTLNGLGNLGIGSQTLENNQNGNYNTAVGGAALYNGSGNENVAIGLHALYNGSNRNVGIGAYSGKFNLGLENVFIGYKAGMNATGDGKLYIANSETATPLVYGDFTAKYLAVGEVAAADRAAATSGGYRLLVKGGMITEKIKVATAGSADWADYVFEKDYKILPLEQVEKFIKENKHLPNVPSTVEMIQNGNDLGKTDAKLLEKIEELTLYIIELNKEIQSLKQTKK